MTVRAGGARACAVVVAAMVAVLPPGAAAAGTNTSADGTGGASVAESAGPNRFVVKPGQSLNDIASAVVQSNDRAMRDRMVALLFEANPSAFMGRDPNRLKIGAVIRVPDDAAATVTTGASAMAASGAGNALPPAASGTAAPGGAASSSAARAVSTPTVAASQGTDHASARTGASLRLSSAIAAGAAVLAVLLVGLLSALVRRRRRTAANGDMGGAQGVGPREETRAGAARAPDDGLPHRVLAIRTGSEPSDGAAAHAADTACESPTSDAGQAGLLPRAVSAAGAHDALSRGDTVEHGPNAAPPSSSVVLAASAAESLTVTATHAGERQTPLAPDFPAHAAAALASLELSLPPLSSTPSSANDAAIAAVERDAPMASPPSVAPPPGVGAAPFGALNLDFDLNLPPLAEQPCVVSTPDELAAIARNKLDLAVEYMELGDAAGARALVSEVIASNESTTLDEARKLHAVLTPL
ncbi:MULTISPECIES: FimV/HubP family polar landmark protein [Burkholderiaceae]|uniref:FimV/HubP family polar landmark protein n=1 Tax=Burkholderiaceae TaxID=119060 RepID=UPI00095AE3AE|nr:MULTISPECIES: FimV/HubP family polar landmark protein [Burkholderiaceae]MCG1019028.1 hypothetical protein [Mycetohabitans sp. B4]SIT73715.1 FimV C-terminal domain-containing protein [Burkholderia sp. b13]